MDCAGASVEIIDSRINATLVLLNAGASTIISGSVLMDPPTSGWPALLVDGALALEAQSSDLNESLTGNLNPPGSSYQGSSDADTTDQYPSEINGIVMVSGALTIRNAPTINGWIFAERAVSVTSATLVIRAVTAMSGPPGFRPSPGFKISPGGVVRVVE
jgi:hypothetical protein